MIFYGMQLYKNNKTPGWGSPVIGMSLIVSDIVCALDKLAHSPYCAYVQIVVKDHDISILVLLQ